MQISLLPSLSNLPSSVMDKANKTYKGRTLTEIAVAIGTILSAALTVLNHYHHNAGHRNYCLAVTGVGIILYLSLASARKLGDVNQRMEVNLQNFSLENDRFATQNDRLTNENDRLEETSNNLSTEVTELKDQNGELKLAINDFSDIKEKFNGDIGKAILDYREANTKNLQAAEKNQKTAERLAAETIKHAANNAQHSTLIRFHTIRDNAIRLLEINEKNGTLSGEDKELLEEIRKAGSNIDSVLINSMAESTFKLVQESVASTAPTA